MTAEEGYCVIRWLIPGNWNALTGSRGLRRISVGIYKTIHRLGCSLGGHQGIARALPADH